MALYFYFNETTGDLVYSDQATYETEGYTSLGEQTNMNPRANTDWVYDSKRSVIKTVTKDPTVVEKIAGLTSMYYMFYGCSGLKSIDLSGFDTSKVTNMFGMFNGCSGLASLDLSSFDTSKVTTMDNMFVSCSLDVVRCRPRQFSRPAIPTADEAAASFLIPSSSGSWYDFKGAEVTDFTSDVATSLYSDPSKAPDGSKLVNLQDLKAALETMGGSSSSALPFTEDTVIAEVGGQPVWGYEADVAEGFPGFIGRHEQEGSWAQARLFCMALLVEGLRPVGDSGFKRMGIEVGMISEGPAVMFMDDSKTAALVYRDGMPVLSAMGESGPVMAGDHPYGFATYATDSDFMDYITQTE